MLGQNKSYGMSPVYLYSVLVDNILLSLTSYTGLIVQSFITDDDYGPAKLIYNTYVREYITV